MSMHFHGCTVFLVEEHLSAWLQYKVLFWALVESDSLSDNGSKIRFDIWGSKNYIKPALQIDIKRDFSCVYGEWCLVIDIV